jgi:PAS domain S-box-containing protein
LRTKGKGERKRARQIVQELPVITWQRDSQGKLTDISPEVEDELGYTAQEVLNMEKRRHTFTPNSADAFDEVFRDEMARRGETSARMFKADLAAKNGAVMPYVLLMIFVRNDGHFVEFQGYGCSVAGWQSLPDCCQAVMHTLVSAVAEEYQPMVMSLVA